MFFDGNKLCQPEPTKIESKKYIQVTWNGGIFQEVSPYPINQLVYTIHEWEGSRRKEENM